VKEHDDVYKWLSLFVVLIGTFMSVLSSSLINLALPKMMSVFGVTLSDITWVVTAYTLAMGAVVNWLLKRYHRIKEVVYSGTYIVYLRVCFIWNGME